MQAISPTLQTLYADLAQQVFSATEKAASIYTQKQKGIDYLYAKWRVVRVVRSAALGRADNPDAQQRAEQIRAEQARAKERRKIIATLRNNGIPTPTRALGNVLYAISDAGLFDHAVLVGTAAYICYSPIIGVVLPSGVLTTQDADLATASLAIAGDGDDTMLDILKRADETFRPIPALEKGAPSSSFKSMATGFIVDLLTPQRRRLDANPIPLENLAAGAVPLQHLDWLIADPLRAVALHGAGIPIRIPQPAKYAVHKLIVAQKRRPDERPKRGKDLLQAKALIEALAETDPFELRDAIDEASAQGLKGWHQPIKRSLKELDLELDQLV
jgi:hypothetical protein